MDLGVIYDMLKAYLDAGAIALGLFLTQVIKGLLPTPAGGKKFDVGPIATRILPAIPVLIGAATVVVKDGWITPTMTLDEAVVKGLVSGAVAAYLFRTGKVSVFGGGSNGNGTVAVKSPPDTTVTDTGGVTK
jgi:hypothetical protein